MVSHAGGQITAVTMIDHYRIHWEIFLAVIFGLLLVLFAGPGGLRALLSFAITVLSIWKIMVPATLKGADPIWVGLLLVALLTVVIIVFVYGFDRRSLSAVLGSMLGTLTACVLGVAFTGVLHIHGAVMQDSESLLYAGYQNLNLTRIFMASIFIGAAGAMIDLSVDITSGICEVVRKKPGIRPWEAVGQRRAHRPGGHGHHDHHAAAGVLGRVHGAADGVYGAGHAAGQHFQLQVCSQRAAANAGGLLRPGDGGPLHGTGRRFPAHAPGRFAPAGARAGGSRLTL